MLDLSKCELDAKGRPIVFVEGVAIAFVIDAGENECWLELEDGRKGAIPNEQITPSTTIEIPHSVVVRVYSDGTSEVRPTLTTTSGEVGSEGSRVFKEILISTGSVSVVDQGAQILAKYPDQLYLAVKAGKFCIFSKKPRKMLCGGDTLESLMSQLVTLEKSGLIPLKKEEVTEVETEDDDLEKELPQKQTDLDKFIESMKKVSDHKKRSEEMIGWPGIQDLPTIPAPSDIRWVHSTKPQKPEIICNDGTTGKVEFPPINAVINGDNVSYGVNGAIVDVKG